MECNISSPPPHGVLIPARYVCERYGVCTRTLARWLSRPGLDFPRPVKISRRRYFTLSALETWERQRVGSENGARASASEHSAS